MDKIKIVGVPEHFNYPWIKTVGEQPLIDEGIVLEWTDEPKGSGAMNKAIREGKADLAVVLTESFIKDRIEGNPAKMIGFHVLSPLIWGIHVSSRFEWGEKDLKNHPILISRKGSGSHLMAFLLARQYGWEPGQLNFEVIGDLDGAKRAMEGDEPRIFLWEKYTTMPLVKEGLFHRVGEIPSPWPAFVTVASAHALEQYPEHVRKIRDRVYQNATSLTGSAGLPQRLSENYGIALEDIREWLTQTRWASSGQVSKQSLLSTMEILESHQLIQKAIPMEDLVDQRFVTLELR